MQGDVERGVVPGDDSLGPEEPVVIKMNNQHTKLGPGMPVSPLPSSPAPPPQPAPRYPNLRRLPKLRRHLNLRRHPANLLGHPTLRRLPNLRRHPNLLGHP